MRRVVAALLLVFPASWLFAGEAAEKTLLEQWFIMSLAGTPCGYAHYRAAETTDEAGKPLVRTTMEEVMELRLGAQTISISTDSVFVETRDGRMLSFHHVQDDGQTKEETTGRVEDGKLRLTVVSKGETYERTIDFPDDVVVGYAEEMLVRKKGFAPGTTYTYKTYVPAMGVRTSKRQVTGKETLNLKGGKAELNRVDTSGVVPGVVISEYRSDDGQNLASRLPIFGMEFFLEAATAQDVTAFRSRRTAGNLDLLSLRYAKIVNPHPRPRRVQEAAYLIQPADGGQFEDVDLNGAGQIAEALPDGIRVVVRFPKKSLPKRRSGVEQPPLAADAPVLGVAGPSFSAPDCPYRECSAPGPYIQSNLGEVRRRAADITANAADYLDAARRCERWVRENMFFVGSGMHFAPASEILKQRRGDCTEAAVLLASLLRAVGIPCRLSIGVAQLQGQIGFHMWVEVWGGRMENEEVWIPFDSALPSGDRVDATHIRLAAILDDAVAAGSIASIAQMVGRLKVTALEYIAEGVAWRQGEPWASVQKGLVLHKGYLVTFDVPEGMTVSAVEADGEVKFADARDDKHTLRINAREVPPEHDFAETIGGVMQRGWRVMNKDYRSVGGRRALAMTLASGDRKVRTLYIRDGDVLIRLVEEPQEPLKAAMAAVLRSLQFLTEGLDEQGR